MDLTVAYLGQSTLRESNGSRQLQLLPNLTRDPVAFDAALQNPLRFREAISALHDVVINDLRYQPRDKTAYETWKKNETARVAALQRTVLQQAKADIMARQATHIPVDLERKYNQARSQYWNARLRYSNHLRREELGFWRSLMPCDPIVTVAEDSVFFECFSKDESSYGCLSVDRQAGFGRSDNLQFGTTNVDYSWELFHHFQRLRSYRETRLQVDPAGFQVQTANHPDYREEKIPLPPGWLRGLMQVQTAMTLPMHKVTLGRDAIYNLLAWYRRRRAHQSPRAMRFELTPGQMPRIVLEPWEQAVTSPSTTFTGTEPQTIRLWGARRILVLARLLPLIERVDVYLLGTGFPSFWVAQMGEMRLTVGLSGWTTNDWTHGGALDTLAPPVTVERTVLDQIAVELRRCGSAKYQDLAQRLNLDPHLVFAGLNRLAHLGQVIYDLDAGLYRWRQIMPVPLGEAELGPGNPELLAAQQLLKSKQVKLLQQQYDEQGQATITGQVANREVEVFLDRERQIKRGKCRCSHHYQFGIKNGPCRHLQALRMLTEASVVEETVDLARWFERVNFLRRI
jgi:hypothetical protein